MYDSCLIDLHDVLKQYKSFFNILHSNVKLFIINAN